MVNEGVYDGDWQPSLLYPLPKTGKMDSKGKRKRKGGAGRKGSGENLFY